MINLVIERLRMAQPIPYKDEKLKNAICFFANEHEKLTRKPLSQTFLYKYLAFLDFKSIEHRAGHRADLYGHEARPGTHGTVRKTQ